MKRGATVVALLAVGCALGAAAAPALSFSASSWDFGVVASGGTATTDLAVSNASEALVTISLVPACDCLSADPARREIGPGASVTFRISFTAGPEDVGEIRRLLVVSTDAPGQERFLFEVRGTVGEAAASTAAVDRGMSGAPGAIEIVYYYTPGCRSCERFLAEELPRRSRELGVTVSVRRRDVLAEGVYPQYEALARRLGVAVRALPGLLVGGMLLQGEAEIEAGLLQALRSAAGSGGGTTPTTPTTDAGAVTAAGAERVAPEGDATSVELTALPVLAGGLLDGINPCAFTTLLFLIASLSLAGRGRREVLLVGALFSLAVFATYFAVGLGLFTALRAMSAFALVSRMIRWVLVAVLVVFAALSIYDWTLVRQGRSREMLLQLPLFLKQRIHATIRAGVRSAALAGSALVIGFLVSVFEFACTGQVYLPTLAYLARLGRMRAVGLLALYNLGFIAPLLAVFAAGYAGVASQRIAALFQRHLGAVKLALAVFFLALAALTLAT